MGERAARAGVAARVPPLIEAEVGLGITLLLAAASLTSLPPSVDMVADRAAPAEVAARFRPAMPRLSSPPVRELLAAAAPIDDTLARRQPEEYAWSEYNHHAAGFFVFLMGVLALLDRAGYTRWARHWPLLFLGLAAFLFMRNDPRAWPLGPGRLLGEHGAARRAAAPAGRPAGGGARPSSSGWYARAGSSGRAGASSSRSSARRAAGCCLTHSHAMFNLKSRVPHRGLARPDGPLRGDHGLGPLARGAPAAGGCDAARLDLGRGMTIIGLILLVYRETST